MTTVVEHSRRVARTTSGARRPRPLPPPAPAHPTARVRGAPIRYRFGAPRSRDGWWSARRAGVGERGPVEGAGGRRLAPAPPSRNSVTPHRQTGRRRASAGDLGASAAPTEHDRGARPMDNPPLPEPPRRIQDDPHYQFRLYSTLTHAERASVHVRRARIVAELQRHRRAGLRAHPPSPCAAARRHGGPPAAVAEAELVSWSPAAASRSTAPTSAAPGRRVPERRAPAANLCRPAAPARCDVAVRAAHRAAPCRLRHRALVPGQGSGRRHAVGGRAASGRAGVPGRLPGRGRRWRRRRHRSRAAPVARSPLAWRAGRRWANMARWT